MANISIDLDLVNELNTTLNSKLYELDQAINAMNSLRNQLSSNVLRRYSINEQITSINQSITTLATKISNIIQTTAAGAATYREADYSLYCLFMDITSPSEPTANDLAFNQSTEEPFILKVTEMYGDLDIPLSLLLDLCNNDEQMIKAIKLYQSGVQFTSDILSDGKTYLYFKNINNLTHAQVKDLLKNLIQGSENWSDYQVRTFMNRGFDIYKANGDLTRNKSRYFNQVQYEDLSKYIKRLNLSKVDQFTDVFNNTLKDGIIGDFDYSKWSQLSKPAKGLKILGTASTVLSIGSNFIENTYVDGEWTFTPKTVVNTATDVAIDIGSSAGAMATGAAIGSLIAPPIGTVVGIASGAAINLAFNVGITDFDGDGQKDSLVDGAKMAVDTVVDYASEQIGNVVDAVSDGLQDVYEGAKDFVDDIGDFIGDLIW